MHCPSYACFIDRESSTDGRNSPPQTHPQHSRSPLHAHGPRSMQSNLPTREYDVPCALCAQACKAQEASLSTEAILRGYLVKEWTPAIAKHYRPPPAPANDPSGTHAPHPSHICTVLVDELWNLWLAIWATRNDIFLNQNNS